MADITRSRGFAAAPARGSARSTVRSGVRSLMRESTLILGLMFVGLVAHGLNMFNNPGFARFGDEGIYMSQAWAILRMGELAPYTYFYDHAPGGWIMLAAWMTATGGPFTFGGAIDGGRVLLLLLHVAMVPMLYHITRKLGGNMLAAALATLLFSLSPMAIFYQRLVLLDNIMLFWLMISLNLLLDGWGRLSRVILSGLCFGIALVCKETAIFLLPVMLFIAFQQRYAHQGRFAVIGWFLSMAMVASWYPLYAALKGELWPAGQSFGYFLFGQSGGEHVSLVEALRWQATRGGGGMFNLQNEFWQFVRSEWVPRDPVLFIAGIVAIGLNLVRGLRDRRVMVAGLLGLLPLYYLARGGIVLEFYVLFIIPFLCLNIALLLAPVFARVPVGAAPIVTLLLTGGIAGGYWATGRLEPLYTERPGQAARDSISWIKQHVPPESMIVSHDDPWTDLHEPGLGGPAFPNVHNYWKVALDPAIRYGVFKDDWRTVDYVIMLPMTEAILETNNDQVTLGALEHAHIVKRWETDGDVIELWKVDKPGLTEAALLDDSAATISQRFEQNGAFVTSDGKVTSEAQSYAMLRAVWTGDREGFDRAWRWTEAHLMTKDGVVAWLWQDGRVTDAHSAADADTDIALALLMAGKRWNDPTLLEDGTRLVRAIWDHDVTIVNGTPYFTAGNWATESPVVALNPSYFSPYAYRIFKEVDPGHDWNGVIDSSYRVLFDASASPLGAAKSSGLPPDWVGLRRDNGALEPLELSGGDTTRFSYDAVRTYWRVALDSRWSGDGRADAYLRLAGFLRDEVARKGSVSAAYAHDGSVVEIAPSVVSNAGALGALLTLDPAAANSLYASQFVGGMSRSGQAVTWGNADDLYSQEWGWFATALYADKLPDLWHAPGAPATATIP